MSKENRVSDARVIEMRQWAASERADCLADDRPVTADHYGDVLLALTELQSLRSKPVAGVEVKPRTNEQSFNVGYMIAVANLMHLHDEPTMAADVLREAGIDASALEGVDFTDFDLSVLHPLFAALKEA